VQLHAGALSALASTRYKLTRVLVIEAREAAMAQSIREKDKIRQAREEGRPSEDDVAQERLGWRGQKGQPSTDLMTEDNRQQTPSPLDPGHTT